MVLVLGHRASTGPMVSALKPRARTGAVTLIPTGLTKSTAHPRSKKRREQTSTMTDHGKQKQVLSEAHLKSGLMSTRRNSTAGPTLLCPEGCSKNLKCPNSEGLSLESASQIEALLILGMDFGGTPTAATQPSSLRG